MEKDLLEDIEVIENGKVYSTKAIVISSFFAGLLASGYMLYKNYKTFGQVRNANLTMLFSVILFFGILGTGYIPALDKIPWVVYSILYTLGTSIFATKFQGDLISKHVAKAGSYFENGNIILVCLISVLILLAVIFVPFYLITAQN